MYEQADSRGRPVRAARGLIARNRGGTGYALDAAAQWVPKPLVRGGGEETLCVTWLVHTPGTKFLSGSMAGQSPTNMELKAAANWDRLFELHIGKVLGAKHWDKRREQPR